MLSTPTFTDSDASSSAPRIATLVALTVRVPAALRTRAHVHALNRGSTLGDLVTAALRSEDIVRTIIAQNSNRLAAAALKRSSASAPASSRRRRNASGPGGLRVHLTVRVPLELRRDLRDWARAADLTMARFVEHALLAVLAASEDATRRSQDRLTPRAGSGS